MASKMTAADDMKSSDSDSSVCSLTEPFVSGNRVIQNNGRIGTVIQHDHTKDAAYQVMFDVAVVANGKNLGRLHWVDRADLAPHEGARDIALEVLEDNMKSRSVDDEDDKGGEQQDNRWTYSAPTAPEPKDWSRIKPWVRQAKVALQRRPRRQRHHQLLRKLNRFHHLCRRPSLQLTTA